jgi:ribosomal protein L34E
MTKKERAIAQCKICEAIDVTEVWAFELDLWIGGDLAQDVWPNKSPQERELIRQSQWAKYLNRPFPGPYYICAVCDEKFEEESDVPKR